MDMEQLNKEFDRVKVEVFLLRKNSMFLGTILANMDFEWNSSISTAGVSTKKLIWSPEFFEKSSKQIRVNTLVHEINHVARLHFLRRGDRDPRLWNIACDIRINTDMEEDGLSWNGFNCYLDRKNEFVDMSEEEIYEKIKEDESKISGSSSYGIGIDNPIDMEYEEVEPEPMQQVNMVIQAIQVAKASAPKGSGYGIDFPGNIEEFITEFLTPQVNWRKQLREFFIALGNKHRDHNRPNRRYSHVILPSRRRNENNLDSIYFFVDSSGSVDEEQSRVIGSEIKYIWDTYKPKSMEIHQFTTKITHSLKVHNGTPFDTFFVKGRGGTHLEPVREKIIENKPSMVVIFSDLECAPMGELPKEFKNLTIFWVCVDNKHAEVDFGKIIHVRSIT